MNKKIVTKEVYQTSGGWVRRLADGTIIGPFGSEKIAKNSYSSPAPVKVKAKAPVKAEAKTENKVESKPMQEKAPKKESKYPCPDIIDDESPEYPRPHVKK